MDQQTLTRNDTLEFGRRTRRNFEFIEGTKHKNPDAAVHVITQLTLSLLGIVVFPYEKIDKSIFAKAIADVRAEGWLGWSITLDKPTKSKLPTATLGDLLWHLRNAVAHGRITFSSDNADIDGVVIMAEDKPQAEKAAINWQAQIEGSHLRTFCLRFLEFVDGVVG